MKRGKERQGQFSRDREIQEKKGRVLWVEGDLMRQAKIGREKER